MHPNKGRLPRAPISASAEVWQRLRTSTPEKSQSVTIGVGIGFASLYALCACCGTISSAAGANSVGILTQWIVGGMASSWQVRATRWRDISRGEGTKRAAKC